LYSGIRVLSLIFQVFAYRLFVGKPEGKSPLGRPRLGEWIILVWILERWERVVWTGVVWLRIGTGGELL
jgi:hypothetical protein